MKEFFKKLVAPLAARVDAPALAPVLDVEALERYVGGEQADWTGEKYPGGLGPAKLYTLDYWQLRTRSRELFQDNLYGRGLVRRLLTNEINTGLTLESHPEETILGFPEDSLGDWTEDVENRFHLWAKNAELCDYSRKRTFGAIQRQARLTALISGDVLVVLRTNSATGLPMVQLIPGGAVQTPFDYRPRGNRRIVHGVEFNDRDEPIAYHVLQDDMKTKRLPAFGSRSGRRIAWLYHGSDKLHDGARGEPLLSIVLQSIKELDRYRDSAQRKAVLNSILAMFIKKTEDKPGTLPVTGGMVRKDDVAVPQPDGKSRKLGLGAQMPGVIMEELQTGEEPVGFSSQGTDINFPAFEDAIIRAIAWANEVPPEILQLSFSSNYSASQAAINEFKIYLNKTRTDFGETFAQPVYNEWFVSQILTGKISADGFLAAWRDPMQYDRVAAWLSADWSGAIKPSTDILKQAKGYELLVKEGNITRARASRELTGTKYSKNIKQLKRENQLLVEAARPIAEFRAEFGESNADQSLDDAAAKIAEAVEETIEK